MEASTEGIPFSPLGSPHGSFCSPLHERWGTLMSGTARIACPSLRVLARCVRGVPAPALAGRDHRERGTREATASNASRVNSEKNNLILPPLHYIIVHSHFHIVKML